MNLLLLLLLKLLFDFVILADLHTFRVIQSAIFPIVFLEKAD